MAASTAPHINADASMSFLYNPIHASIDYTIWTQKSKSGKQAADPTWEAAKPSKKITVSFAGPNTSSFKNAKFQIFTELEETESKAVTVLSAADIGEGHLGDLKWQAYISKSRLYPKTGDRICFITSDDEWMEYLRVCNVSRDKVCGLSLVMENPAVEKRKKRQNDALSKEAAKIKRRQNRRKDKRSKKTHGNQGLTSQERALDDDAEPINDDAEPNNKDDSSDSAESTGGDTDTDEIRAVADDIYKFHSMKPEYSQSTPVFVDPLNSDRFFYITTRMARIWAKEKLECDANGTCVVTIAIPPKASGIQWLSKDQQPKRRKTIPSSSDSNLRDMAMIIKEVFNPISQQSNARDSSSEPVLNAPLSDYLKFCGINDVDGSIEERLVDAGFDQHSLFIRDHLPREDLVKMNLRPGDITRLYLNVKRFSKKLNDENVQ